MFSHIIGEGLPSCAQGGGGWHPSIGGGGKSKRGADKQGAGVKPEPWSAPTLVPAFYKGSEVMTTKEAKRNREGNGWETLANAMETVGGETNF